MKNKKIKKYTCKSCGTTHDDKSYIKQCHICKKDVCDNCDITEKHYFTEESMICAEKLICDECYDAIDKRVVKMVKDMSIIKARNKKEYICTSCGRGHYSKNYIHECYICGKDICNYCKFTDKKFFSSESAYYPEKLICDECYGAIDKEVVRITEDMRKEKKQRKNSTTVKK